MEPTLKRMIQDRSRAVEHELCEMLALTLLEDDAFNSVVVRQAIWVHCVQAQCPRLSIKMRAQYHLQTGLLQRWLEYLENGGNGQVFMDEQGADEMIAEQTDDSQETIGDCRQEPTAGDEWRPVGDTWSQDYNPDDPL